MIYLSIPLVQIPLRAAVSGPHSVRLLSYIAAVLP